MKKNKKQERDLLAKIELFSYSLIAGDFISRYIENNTCVRGKKALLSKAVRAKKLIDDIHQEAHLMFAIEHTMGGNSKKGQFVQKIIHN